MHAWFKVTTRLILRCCSFDAASVGDFFFVEITHDYSPILSETGRPDFGFKFNCTVFN